jgi:hypothetical protein
MFICSPHKLLLLPAFNNYLTLLPGLKIAKYLILWKKSDVSLSNIVAEVNGGI